MTQPVAGGEISLGTLVAYLDELLEARKGSDFGPNGLQVEGRDRVRKVVTGVSACGELFERARVAGADAVLVHHGLFWDGQPVTLTGFRYRRVAELIAGGMSLIAYHLPLDRNPELGNNALAARAFGLEEVEPFGEHGGQPVGCKGRFPEAVPPARLVELCRSVFGQEPLAFLFGRQPVATIGLISGGGQGEIHQAIAQGLDAYVTGEASEWVMNVARDAGIHFLAAGHYATERLGVRALGEHVARRFGIEAEFVDVPNPV
ncbi:MAG TPA: Nif3-like dinuclear metal center hexameric protein [Thermoanaerobaculia bacterium]|nr:Nif3-like dinuclear metal center hexameric protein [Thermoanaerobaculia bacterium]